MTELRDVGVPEQLVAHNQTVWKNQQAERPKASKK